MEQQTSTYKTLPGGSIDYAFYDARARAIRGQDTLSRVRALWEWLRQPNTKEEGSEDRLPGAIALQG